MLTLPTAATVNFCDNTNTEENKAKKVQLLENCYIKLHIHNDFCDSWSKASN